MFRVKRRSQAGLAEKNDVFIVIEPRQPGTGRDIAVKSPSMIEFGRHISETIEGMLEQYGVDDVRVIVEDRGALDFTIRARCETALRRSFME